MRSDSEDEIRFFAKYVSKNIQTTKLPNYKSWIPSNLGKINFGYIVNELYLDEDWKSVVKNFKTKEIVFIDLQPKISDQMSLNINDVYRFLPGQEKPISILDISYSETNKKYTGKATVYYVDKKKFNIVKNEARTLNAEILNYYKSTNYIDEDRILQYHKDSLMALDEYLKWSNNASALVKENSVLYMNCNFEITPEGIIDISDMKINALTFDKKKYEQLSTDEEQDIFYDLGISFIDMDDYRTALVNDIDTIALVLYTSIKRAIHVDNHHHSKLDTMIPVVEKSEYAETKVLESMSDRIKDIETILRGHKKEPEAGFSSNADGVYSYMLSFAILNNNEGSKTLKLASSVINSIKALDQRIEKYTSCSKHVLNILKIAFTILISSLILTTGVITLYSLALNSIPIYSSIIIVWTIVVLSLIFGPNHCGGKIIIQYIGRERFSIAQKRKRFSYAVTGFILAAIIIGIAIAI